MSKIVIMTDRVFFKAYDVKSITMSENINFTPKGEMNKVYYVNIVTLDEDPSSQQQANIVYNDYDQGGINIMTTNFEDAQREMKEIMKQLRDQRKDDIHMQEMFEKHFSEAITSGGSKNDGSTKKVRKARGTKRSR